MNLNTKFTLFIAILLLLSCISDKRNFSKNVKKIILEDNPKIFQNKDSVYYEKTENGKVNLKIYSEKYGTIFYGNTSEIEIPKNIQFGLEESCEYYFLLKRSCGSECSTYALVDIRNGKTIFEEENLIYYNLKAKILFTQDSENFKLIELKDKKAVIVKSIPIYKNVMCPQVKNCMEDLNIDVKKRNVSFNLLVSKAKQEEKKLVTFSW